MERLFSFEFNWPPLPLLVGGLLCILIAMLLAHGSSMLIEDGRVRRKLTLLRSLALIALLALLIQPDFVIQQAEIRKTPFIVMVDGSPSMLTDNEGFKRAENFIRDHAKDWEKLSEKYHLDFHLFSSDTMPDSLGGRNIKPLTRFKTLTSLSDALDLIREDRPGGVLLLSDGGFSDALSSRKGMGLPLFEKGDPFLNCRMYPVKLSQEASDYNLSITNVSADEFAYVKNPFSLKIKIHAKAPRALKVPVRISCGRENVGSLELALRKGEGDYEGTVEVTPDKTGYFIYAVTLPSYAFEGSADDNRKEFAIKVIRDRIRVMQIAGRPSWDVRFLRETLKKDPAVDLVAFYILRTASDVVDVAQDELSLIEFPHRDLFDKDLSTFDVVIFQNFSYRMFFGPEYIDNLKKFVESGGAFWMIGGDLAFSEGGYRGTAAEVMLPYNLSDPERGASQGEYSVVLSKEGESHPVTAGVTDLAPVRFEGLNALGALKENGLTLLETREGRPFLGVREFGKGRTAALATDAFWFYHFVNAGAGEGNRSYQELVRRLIRWLVKDPAVGGTAFTGLRNDFDEGSNIPFSVQYQGEVSGRRLRVSLLDGNHRTVDSRELPLTREKNYPMDFKNPGRGLFIARAEIVKAGKVQDGISESFQVTSLGEHGDPALGEALLNALAQETKGEVLAFNEKNLADRIQVPGKSVKRILGKRAYPLWNTFAAIILVCLAFGAEWFLRKRKGLM